MNTSPIKNILIQTTCEMQMTNTKTFIQIILVAIAAFAAFFFIYVNIPQQNGIQLYFMDIFNSLMGAVVVALVTASIFIFQRRIESDDEKNRAIYEKKLALYEELASKLNEIIQDKKISDAEVQELHSFTFKIFLIAGPKAGEQFIEVLANLSDGVSQQIEKTSLKSILDFIALCRRDLEVLKDIEQGQKQELENFLKRITSDERIAESLSGTRRKFNDSFRRAVVDEYDAAATPDERAATLQKYKLWPVQITTFRRKLEKTDVKKVDPQ
jgi:hypothetical protein